MIEDMNPPRNGPEDEPESSNTVWKLSFATPPVDAPPSLTVAPTEGNHQIQNGLKIISPHDKRGWKGSPNQCYGCEIRMR